MKLNQRGFSSLIIILLIIIALVSVAGIRTWNKERNSSKLKDTSAHTSAVTTNNAAIDFSKDNKVLKIGNNLELTYPGNWAIEAAGIDYDYALVGDVNYKIFIEVLQPGEIEADNCGSCTIGQLNTGPKLGEEKLYTISTTVPGIASSNDNADGIPAYTTPASTSVRLSSCPTTYCPPLIPGTENKLHIALHYFVDGGIPSNLDIKSDRSKEAIKVLENLKFIGSN